MLIAYRTTLTLIQAYQLININHSNRNTRWSKPMNLNYFITSWQLNTPSELFKLVFVKKI